MANMQALLWQSSDWLVGAVLPAVITDETNKARADSNLPPLVRSSVLDDAATRKAHDMVQEGYFAHYSPAGISPWHWFDEVGYTYAYAGENLAVHFTDSKDVVEAWLKSPTHRANIEQATYQEIGIGTARGRFEGFDTIFVVQLFGTPALPAPERVLVPNDVLGTLVAPVAATTTGTTTSDVLTQNEADALAVVAGESTVGAILLAPTPDPVYQEPAPVEPSATIPDSVETPKVVPVVVLDTVSSSSGLIPRDDMPVPDVRNQSVSEFSSLATQPGHFLQLVYIILGSLVCGALITSVVLAWRTHSVRYVLKGVLLLVIMSILFYVHIMVTSGVLIK